MSFDRKIERRPRTIALGVAAAACVGVAATVLTTVSVYADASDGTPLETTPVAVADAADGARTEVPMRLRGTSDTAGIVLNVSDFRDLPYNSDYSNCGAPDEEPGGFLCVWPDLTIADGEVYEVSSDTPIGFTVDENTPGPVDVCFMNGGCTYWAEAMGTEDAQYWLDYIGGDMTEPAELVPGDDDPADEWGEQSEIEFVTAENPADVEVADTHVDGGMGDQVALQVSPKNLGPADWLAPTQLGEETLKITLPTGLKVVDPAGCDTDGDRRLTCATDVVWADTTPTREFVVEIVDAIASRDGEIFFDTAPKDGGFYDVNLDPNQDNNKAVISLDAS
ncbi:MAG: hypothetical protein ACRDXX_22230 [Stackebrandtia sp.]